MTYRLEVNSLSKQDLAEAKKWYDKKEDGLGDDFLDEAYRTFEQIEERPLSFELAAKDVRRACIDRYPYVVYFRVVSDWIDVFAVVHGHRHHRVWRSRLK